MAEHKHCFECRGSYGYHYPSCSKYADDKMPPCKCDSNHTGLCSECGQLQEYNPARIAELEAQVTELQCEISKLQREVDDMDQHISELVERLP